MIDDSIFPLVIAKYREVTKSLSDLSSDQIEAHIILSWAWVELEEYLALHLLLGERKFKEKQHDSAKR